MQTQFAPPPSQPAATLGSIALLKLLIARHPYRTSVFFLVYWLALLLAAGRVLARLFFLINAPLLVYEIISETVVALIVVFPLTLLRWWPESGITRGINGRGLLLCLFPAALIVGPTLLAAPGILGDASASILVAAIVLSLLIGFAEETMFRGLLMRCLLPRGIWPAVLFSTLCFTLIHLSNLLGSDSWGYVFGQLVLTFGSGALFAALRLRTGSLWPCILIHAGRDVVGLVALGLNPLTFHDTPSLTSQLLNGGFSLLYLSTAALLLRQSQRSTLEAAYDLGTPASVGPAASFPPDASHTPDPSHPAYGDESSTHIAPQ